ncbi:MAG: cysteine desulfurase family protein [Erysipelotrichaceae bacterium]
MIYLDNAATTRLEPEVRKTYVHLLDTYFANSSSIHALGVKTHSLLQQSRSQIAHHLKVNSQELTFTASASEANNLAIKGYALANQQYGKHLICSKVEHSSVLGPIQQLQDEFGFEVSWLEVNHDGVVEPATLEKAMRPDTILVCAMMVNNEVGSINPIQKLAAIAHTNPRCVFFADGVQALGKIPVSLDGVDLASFSAHKINGLKGSGLLFHRKNVKLMPQIVGGEQEEGLRAGTSNVLTNIVLAKTIRLALEKQPKAYEQAKKLNQFIRSGLYDTKEVVFHSSIEGSPFILSLSVLGMGSEVLMNALEAREIYVSAKSTCSSKSKAYSKVLGAMGKTNEEMHGVLRVSFDSMTTLEEAKVFVKHLKEILHDYRTQ